MHAMFEREQTREKNLQAAKRFGSSEKKSTRRATELMSKEEKMKQILVDLEVEFHAKVDVPTEGMEEFVREEIPP